LSKFIQDNNEIKKKKNKTMIINNFIQVEKDAL